MTMIFTPSVTMMVRGINFNEKNRPEMIFSTSFGSIVSRCSDQAAFCSGVAGGLHNKARLVAFQPEWLLLVDGSVDFYPPDSVHIGQNRHSLSVNDYLDKPN